MTIYNDLINKGMDKFDIANIFHEMLSDINFEFDISSSTYLLSTKPESFTEIPTKFINKHLLSQYITIALKNGYPLKYVINKYKGMVTKVDAIKLLKSGVIYKYYLDKKWYKNHIYKYLLKHTDNHMLCQLTDNKFDILELISKKKHCNENLANNVHSLLCNYVSNYSNEMWKYNNILSKVYEYKYNKILQSRDNQYNELKYHLYTKDPEGFIRLYIRTNNIVSSQELTKDMLCLKFTDLNYILNKNLELELPHGKVKVDDYLYRKFYQLFKNYDLYLNSYIQQGAIK